MTWHLANTSHAYFIFVGVPNVQIIKKMRNKAYSVNGNAEKSKSNVVSRHVDIILLSLHFSKFTVRLKRYWHNKTLILLN